ncbi:HNH endonuclease family protein [Leifsonia aquatica]|uniref:HNH endonuclease family protein n=1 Tax=Leifsonia aquatica TaxID=144185 RepID=UPI00380871D4
MTRRRSPARLVTTLAGMALAAVLGLCGYAVVTGGGAGGAGAFDSSAVATPGTATEVAPAAPGARDAGVPSAAEARTLLAGLPVKGSAPKTGYDRVADFGEAWLDVDGNGCDTRDDILARDLTGVVRRGSCTVLSGTLNDPYTGTRIAFERGVDTSARVQIDHVIPLMDAWRTGAQGLSQEAREHLANDPLNLVAVDGPTNQQKGAGDAATWLPPAKAYRCTYAARQVAVKSAYGLWVVPAERAALERILAAC